MLKRKIKIEKLGKELTITLQLEDCDRPYIIKAVVEVDGVTAQGWAADYGDLVKSRYGIKISLKDEEKFKQVMGIDHKGAVVVTHPEIKNAIFELRHQADEAEVQKIAKEGGADKVEVGKIVTKNAGEGTEVKVPISVWVNGKKFEFTARNIFDFGLVINPKYKYVPGGVMDWMDETGNWWKGANGILIPMSDDEVIAVTVAHKVANKMGLNGIRM